MKRPAQAVRRRLTDAVKRRIVEYLACFHSHGEVTDMIREEFDVILTPRHVRAYDPTCFQFASGAKWQDFHAQARKRCLEMIADVPISHRAFRLRRLDQIHEKALKRGDLARAQSALEQAAKEVGNVFTNVHKVQGAGIVAHVHSEVERTPEEARNMLADRLKEALERASKTRKITTEH